MSKKFNATNKSVPTLRFPEFDDKGEAKVLVDLCDRIGDGIHSTPIYSDSGEYHFINGNNLNGGTIKIESTTKTLDIEEAKKHKRPLSENTILLSINGTIGNIAFYRNEQVVLGKSACYIDVKNSAASKHYIYNLLGTERVRCFFDSELTGSTIKNLSLATVRNLNVILPSLPEQQKIADFLTAVDKRIEQLSQKKALLEDYKKGVMQGIFTQSIRFKDDDGNDFPDWEEKKYSDVYSFQHTNSFSRDLLNYESGEVRNIHYGDIHTKFKSNFRLAEEKVPFVNPDIDLSRIAEECYCQKGDLVIADASEDYADVGKCIEIRDLNEERTLAGLHTFIARPKADTMAPGFGVYLMKSWEMRLKIMTIAHGTKVLSVSKPNLSNLILPIPSLDEQTKIANFLSAIDRKIESVSSQITETQTFKKGLLQQMFV